MTDVRIAQAISAWRVILAADAVCDDTETRQRYARTTQLDVHTPCCVLYPKSVEEVQALVRVAVDYEVVLYPLSRGKNWGYGDAAPMRDDAAMVDLSRMDRILEINVTMGYAVIEPGVTQQQLYEAVQAQAPAFWIDCTGAGPDASIVGNALERGFGHTPYGDHVRTACGLQVVLPEGDVLETGFGRFTPSETQYLYPYGLGPILDGLFSQSNFGIVTRMGIWLYPAPEAFRFFYIQVADEARLSALVDALRPLRLQGVLNSAVHIGNDLRLISSAMEYPWERAGGKSPLPAALRETLAREMGLSAWNVSGSLTGTSSQVRAAMRQLRRAVGGLGKVGFVGDTKLALGLRVSGWLQRFGLGSRLACQLRLLAPNYGLLKGIPTDEPLRGVLWRSRREGSDSLDSLDHNVGLLWISPVVPLCGKDAEKVLHLITPIFHRHGFDLPLTYTLLNERSMVGIINISYDRDDPAECEAARACYEEGMTALLAAGYPPYRTGYMGMGKTIDASATYKKTIQRLKAALDPKDILGRGNYVPPLKD